MHLLIWLVPAVFAATDWWAVGRDDRRTEAWAKPATLIALLVAAAAQGATDTTAGLWLLAALAFGALGDVALLSDEIYRSFCYDADFVSPARWNDDTIVIDGFSKSHSMTGWRIGVVHGPAHVMQQMIKLQQFTFVCAPHPMQWAALTAADYDITGRVDEYREKRDFMVRELSDDYEIAGANGAFYLFVKVPWETATEFVKAAIDQNLLVIPGNVFSSRDTHFRISYAAENSTLERGVEVLKKMAKGPTS